MNGGGASDEFFDLRGCAPLGQIGSHLLVGMVPADSIFHQAFQVRQGAMAIRLLNTERREGVAETSGHQLLAGHEFCAPEWARTNNQAPEIRRGAMLCCIGQMQFRRRVHVKATNSAWSAHLRA